MDSEEFASNIREKNEEVLEFNTTEIYNKIRQRCNYNTINDFKSNHQERINFQTYDSFYHFENKIQEVKEISEKKEIREMNMEELIDFLSVLEPDMSETFEESFTNHAIDGRVFLKLKEGDLDNLGIKRYSDRIILRELINKFRRLNLLNRRKNKLESKKLLEKHYSAEKMLQSKKLKSVSSVYSNNSGLKKSSPVVKRKNSSLKERNKSSKHRDETQSLELFESVSAKLEKKSSISIDSNPETKNMIFNSSQKKIEKYHSCERSEVIVQSEFKNHRKQRSLSYNEFEDDKLNSSAGKNETMKDFDEVSLIPNFQESLNSLNFRASGSSSSSQDSDEDSEAGAYYIHNKEHRSLRLKLDSTKTMRKFEIKKEDLDLVNEYEFIGNGEYGKVYKTRLYSSTVVAVKIFDNNKIKNQIIKDIMEEAELLLSIRFPNIIMCMGWCMHSNLLMLVFEYMHQGSLFKVLHQDKQTLNCLTKLEILRKIASGMRHLHSREILHGDLKSSNILLADDFGTVKVCDLGMSFLKNKLKKKNNKWNSLSHYSAPEILRGEKFENSADVYSFGMIIWEMLTGSKPYQTFSKSHLVGIVGYDCNHKLRLANDEVEDNDLYQLMLGTLDRIPEKRPTFKEISKRLGRIIDERKRQAYFRRNLGELLSCNETDSD